MELPDFMSYANKFSQSDFVETISKVAKRAGAKLVYTALILYYTLQSDKISKTDKAIIIGKRGAMLGKIGSEARADIERLLGAKVNLKLWVKVREDWRNRLSDLRALGYEQQK